MINVCSINFVTFKLKPIERYALKFLETYGDISLVREDEQEVNLKRALSNSYSSINYDLHLLLYVN